MISQQSLDHIRKRRERPAFGAGGNFDLAALRQGMATRREPVGISARYLCTRADGVPCEWVLAEHADPDVRMLYLHGGGYVSGSGAFYIAQAARISAAARCAVLLADYRLAPEHRFPIGLEDCLRAFDWISQNSPTARVPARSTFIAGDSAGGGLTLAALLALRDRRRTLPDAGIALSPFADLTLAGDSITSQADLDPIMHPACLPGFVNLYVNNPADVHHPLASPIFGDYTGLPPMLIQVGEHEVIRDDSVRAAARARAAGVDVTLEIWPGMIHVFHSQAEPPLPEGQQAIDRIAQFMRVHGA